MSDTDRRLSDEGPRPSPRWQFLQNLSRVTAQVGDVLTKTAASAQEMLQDKDLRRKGAQFVQNEASRALQNLQIGVERAAENLGQRISVGAGSLSRNLGTNRRQLQTLLGRIERQIQDYQREKALKETRKQPVDVQIGHQLFENMPQELRTRLWFVLLENPHLVEPIRPIQNGTGIPTAQSLERVIMDDVTSGRPRPGRLSLSRRSHPSNRRHSSSSGGGGSTHVRPANISGCSTPVQSAEAAASSLRRLQSSKSGALSPVSRPSSHDGTHGGSKWLPSQPSASKGTLDELHWSSLGREPSFADAVGCTASAARGAVSASAPTSPMAMAGTPAPPAFDVHATRPTSCRSIGGDGEPAPCAFGAAVPTLGTATSFGSAGLQLLSQTPAGGSGDGNRHMSVNDYLGEEIALKRTSSGGSGDGGRHLVQVTVDRDNRNPATVPEEEAMSPGTSTPSTLMMQRTQSDRVQVPDTLKASCSGGNDAEDWEIVPEGATSPTDFAGLDGSDAVRLILARLCGQSTTHLADSSGSDTELLAKQLLFEAMLQVPCSPAEGGHTPYPPDCRFASLNEITAGQEEVDEIINRDINRTFPEHPFFGLDDGQQALFRVLKAYSLHDLEVGYCQGMAFAAGVLLMYLPQEPAFRLFCRLMDPDGPNLRRLYLPGLDALKAELSRFEYLMARFMPALYSHLQAYGVPAVLYTSQWLMTAFATPFPPSFCARLIDIMLQDNNDHMLMRVALAVMEEVQEDLLQLHDFEAIITHLKVQPLQWGTAAMRRVLDRGLNSNVGDADMASAAQQVAAEMAKLAARDATGAAAASAGAAARAAARQRASSLKKRTAAASAAAAAAAVGGTAAAAVSGASSAPSSPLNEPPPQWVGGASAWGLGGSGSALAADLDSLGDRAIEAIAEGAGSEAARSSSGATEGCSHASRSGEVPPLDLDSEYMDMILELNLLVSGDQELPGIDEELAASGNVESLLC